jgi:hypothetical protein
MTINELKNIITGIEGAAMARNNKTNFVVIPCEDGVAKVTVQAALAKDTKNHTAFNMEAAIAEYKAWEAENALKVAEKAAKPKVQRGPNPEAQARRDELDAKIAALPSFVEYTATDIRNALGNTVPDNVLVMQVGSAARRLVEKGVLVATTRDGDKKPYYTKA